MNRDDLAKSWAITRKHLQRAQQQLSSLPTITVETLSQLVEYLDENELELALDELAEIGAALEHEGTARCPDEFWDELVHAAINMKLEKRAEQLRHRSPR